MKFGIALLATVIVPAYGSPFASSALTEPVPRQPDCEVVIHGTAGSAGDEERAIGGCERARSRFAELFGEPVPPVRVILWDWPGYRIGVGDGIAVILWPKHVALTDADGGGERGFAYAAGQWRDVLPHEISHALLAARFFGDNYEPTPGAYGTPFPDWLDEGVAIWAESGDNVRGRLAQARRLPAERLDLRQILSTPHPAAGNAEVLAIRDGAAIPEDEALWAFYPQSIAVLSFVRDTGGQAATAELARRLAADPSATDALAGLPGMPTDMKGVVAAWERWLGSSSPAR
jgi:hypothetical protein